jgi:DNA-binding MarR family transcriptional regulator
VPEAISDKYRNKADALKADVVRQFRELSHHIENSHHPEERLLEESMQKNGKLKNLQLTLTEFHVIACIGDSGQANQTLISKCLNITNAGVYKNILKLAEKKLIETLKLPNNKKEVHYRLTLLGEEIYKLHSELHRIIEHDFLERLSGFTVKELSTVSRFLSEFDKQ